MLGFSSTNFSFAVLSALVRFLLELYVNFLFLFFCRGLVVIAMHFMHCVVLGLVLPGMFAWFFTSDLLEERLDSPAARRVFLASSIFCSVCFSCLPFVPDRRFSVLSALLRSFSLACY